MYIPPKYENKDLGEVREFIAQNSFGILVSQVDGRPWATHIPLELEKDENGNDILMGHIAKANPQWQYFQDQHEVLCIFNGPHSYVSSSWYHDEEVPTWNYVAVHVHGQLNILTESEVMAALHRLVDRYEAASERPISLHHMSPKTLRQIKGVIGFSISIKKVSAAFKLSQGREFDHPAIIDGLERTGNHGAMDIARMMRQTDKKKG
ncbi:MAG: FMN-binding negative transcriptional regulator [Flavobacteriaceae bacterium]